jgi:iron uptake system EfeUOB component EfeO/EfeM
MIIEDKSSLAQNLMDELQKTADKIAFVPDEVILKASRLLENQGIPNSKNEEYRYCNMEAVIRKIFQGIKNVFHDEVRKWIPNLPLRR